jgi:hypothetical protein
MVDVGFRQLASGEDCSEPGWRNWQTQRTQKQNGNAGRTGAERGEPRRVFELWRSDFMSQL